MPAGRSLQDMDDELLDASTPDRLTMSDKKPSGMICYNSGRILCPKISWKDEVFQGMHMKN